MKRILTLALALALPLAASAQLYKWIDKDGRVTYSDQPPPAQAKESRQVNVPTGSTAPQRSAIEKDKELEKVRADSRDKAKAAESAARKAKENEEHCARARSYLRTVTDGGRISFTDDKGERVLMNDEQLEAERVRAQKQADEACKGS